MAPPTTCMPASTTTPLSTSASPSAAPALTPEGVNALGLVIAKLLAEHGLMSVMGTVPASNSATPTATTATVAAAATATSASIGQTSSAPTSSSLPASNRSRNYRIVEGRRAGSKVYVHDGFMYIRNTAKRNNTIVYLRCRHSKSQWCPATAVLDAETDTMSRCSASEHVCGSEPSDARVWEFKKKLYKESMQSSETPSAIYHRLCVSHDSDTVSRVPFEDVSNTMSRIKRRDNMKAPETPQEAVEAFRKGLGPEVCGHLHVASIDDEHGQAIILATQGALQILDYSIASSVGSDGTFDVAPSPFSQLYTLCIDVHDVVVPVVAILMSNKSEALYVAVLERLKARCPMWGISQFMADNEQAVHSAIARTFPLAERKRCLFHFAQALYRKAMRLGLATTHKNNELFQAWFARMQSLPTLPPEQIAEGFDLLCGQVFDDVDFNNVQEELKVWDLLMYVEQQWVDGRIPAEELSVFGLRRRTNNDLESQNAKLTRLCDNRRNIKLPAFLRILRGYLEGADATRIYLQRQEAGDDFKKIRPRDRIIQERKALERQYLKRKLPMDKFLKTMSYKTAADRECKKRRRCFVEDDEDEEKNATAGPSIDPDLITVGEEADDEDDPSGLEGEEEVWDPDDFVRADGLADPPPVCNPGDRNGNGELGPTYIETPQLHEVTLGDDSQTVQVNVVPLSNVPPQSNRPATIINFTRANRAHEAAAWSSESSTQASMASSTQASMRPIVQVQVLNRNQDSRPPDGHASRTLRDMIRGHFVREPGEDEEVVGDHDEIPTSRVARTFTRGAVKAKKRTKAKKTTAKNSKGKRSKKDNGANDAPAFRCGLCRHNAPNYGLGCAHFFCEDCMHTQEAMLHMNRSVFMTKNPHRTVDTDEEADAEAQKEDGALFENRPVLRCPTCSEIVTRKNPLSQQEGSAGQRIVDGQRGQD